MRTTDSLKWARSTQNADSSQDGSRLRTEWFSFSLSEPCIRAVSGAVEGRLATSQDCWPYRKISAGLISVGRAELSTGRRLFLGPACQECSPSQREAVVGRGASLRGGPGGAVLQSVSGLRISHYPAIHMLLTICSTSLLLCWF